MSRTFEVKCPNCSVKFIYQSSPYRPFCSERCKMIDLGKWLNEDYAIPVTSVNLDEAEEASGSIEELNPDSDNEGY